jgi:hypothetical protein
MDAKFSFVSCYAFWCYLCFLADIFLFDIGWRWWVRLIFFARGTRKCFFLFCTSNLSLVQIWGTLASILILEGLETIENSIAPSGWRCSNGVLRYCTVRPLEALWRLGVPLSSLYIWRLGIRTLSPLSRTVRPLGALWRPGVPSPYLTAGCALPLSDGWVYPPFQNRQAARGAVTFNRGYLIQNVVFLN